jgi:hypothetical protein
MKNSKKKIVVVILTFNSESIIKKTILAAKKITKNILILDSFSKDNTLKIVKFLKCKVKKKKFINYSSQRNYIIKKCNNLYEWQLHLDSDEILNKELIKNIKNILNSNEKKYSYLIKRKPYFLNKKINFGGASNWHLRFFPANSTFVEHGNYDQHFKSKLETKNISGLLYDMNVQNLNDWIASHNKWSTSDAREQNNKFSKNMIQPKLFGNNIERLRFYKKLYYLFPSMIRPFLLFIYKYFFLLGFLDGKIGFYYCFFNSLWFRALIDAKKYEKRY